MSAEIEQSSLPPLDSTQSLTKPDLDSSNNSTYNTSQEIKRSILQIYPRLQAIEKDIKNIRQQIPSELNKNILQIRQEVFNLKEKTGNQTIDINDALSQIKDLENQMNFKVDFYINDFSSTLKKKYSNERSKPKYFPPQTFTTSQYDYDKNLDGILNLFNMNTKSTEQRLSKLEQKISKLSSLSTRFQSQDNIEQMRKSIQQQNIKLSELNMNLNTIIESSRQNSSSSNTITNQHPITLVQTDTATSSPKKENPDLTEQIKLLSDQIQNFKTEFENSLISARQKTQNCKNRLAEVKEMANEIHESCTEIESKVIEVNNLCDSLSLQINEISQNLSQNTAQRTIDTISIQIKSVQDRIISELNSIKKRLKKCEMSEPLIKTDFSNNKNTDNSKIDDNDDQLPVVTFGKI